MPVHPTYPGVYNEELPSGVRTITGVATSVTAFVGRARRGPVNETVEISSFTDFERRFGGTWRESTMSYAVRDFYRNGGGRAVIVRLFRPPCATDAGPESDVGRAAAVEPAAAAAAPVMEARLTLDTLNLVAADPGTWGNHLRARVDHDVDPSDPNAAHLFNLFVRDATTGDIEEFRDLSVRDEDERRIDRVLEQRSELVRLDGPVAGAPPAANPIPKAGVEWFDANVPGGNAASVGVANPGSDGSDLVEADYLGDRDAKEGIYALEDADIFNLLCLPPYTPYASSSPSDIGGRLWNEAAEYCEERRAMLIVDPPGTWGDKDAAKAGIGAGVGTVSRNAALFFPLLRQPDPARDGRMGDFAPCGAVAGICARTDAERGVWKAPAGLEATLVGVPGLGVDLTDAENGELNPLGINCLRSFPTGRVIWGSRTMQGDDRLASEWKYMNVRRLALHIEESLVRGTRWAVFEPNDPSLWSGLRLNVGAFMQNLFRQGAFVGQSPREAYLVKCDGETTTNDDVARGIVNVVVGFAPMKPAEFVIIQIGQLAGQVAS